MQIATNTMKIGLNNDMRTNQLELSDRMSKLSTGKRILSASDDTANLQISNRLGKLNNGMNVAIRNANDGISISQTAEGAAQEITNMLQRMRDLAVQSANASNSSSDRKALQQEVGQLKNEINRIAETTSFGGQFLLNGSFGSQQFQVGADANETISIALGSVHSSKLTHNEINLEGGATRSSYVGTSLADARATMTSDSFGNGGAGPATEALTIKGFNTQVVELNSSDSAKQMANDINSVFSQTGVNATASTSLALHVHSGVDTGRVAFEAGEQISFELGNGTLSETISFTATGDLTDDLHSLSNRINENAVVTGIASSVDVNNNQLILTSDSGDNIEISGYSESSEGVDNQLAVRPLNYDDGFAATSSIANDGSAAVVRGTIKLNSIENFNVTSDVDFGTTNNGLGESAGFKLSKESSVADINISTADGAQAAISALDTAISHVDSMRAMLGAVQNRFSTSVSSLAITQENSIAARSRLLDSDFSKETAELAKLQVTQQATTALMSQANSLQDQAIRLLG
ncbi:MAG: flagellin [Gammaproteobacteria bacterium]|nr:flagellin [Gammaproteobacteria bacterium]